MRYDAEAFHSASSLGSAGPSAAPRAYGRRLSGVLGDDECWRPSSPDHITVAAPFRVCAEAVGVAYGSTARGLRNIPSAGALYAGVTILADIATGDARWVWEDRDEDLADDSAGSLAKLIFDRFDRGSLILFAIEMERVLRRYGPRGYRYALIEAGHFGQEVIRALAAQGWSARPLGAFNDEAVSERFGLRAAGFVPLYMLAAGSGSQ